LLNIIEGVQCKDGRTNEPFILRAHLLTWTGDVPALSKSLNLSGHNSYKGCRFCMIKGTCHPSNKHIYYPSSAFCNIRNHDDTINMGKLIEEETNKDRKDEMIREIGMIFLRKKVKVYLHLCINYYYFTIQELKGPVNC